MNLDEDDEESSDNEGIDDELRNLHTEVMENKQRIRIRHESVVSSQLPRRVRDLTETEKFMEKLRVDKKRRK